MKMSVVKVRMSELHTQQLIVGSWEVPVLKAVHGDEFVKEVSAVSQDREPPDAQEEYQRLERRYGLDREQGGLPYVAQVYGQHGAGVERLQDAIDRAAAAGKKKQAESKEATG